MKEKNEEGQINIVNPIIKTTLFLIKSKEEN